MASARELSSEKSDDEVDNLVEHVLQISPNSGEKMIAAGLEEEESVSKGGGLDSQ